jgi:hypothetical protein
MKKIILGSTAIVTDPCYKIPTWCQHIVDNVLPGEYIVDVEKSNQGGWGSRISELSCIHENHINDYLTYKESESIIGVDSGQAGIFDIRSYRNDEQSKSYGIEDNFGYRSEEDGDEWYGIITNLTLGDDQWGTFSHGVVSSSGYGDGAYTLLLAEVDGKVVGLKIIFIDDEDLDEDDFDGYNEDDDEPEYQPEDED